MRWPWQPRPPAVTLAQIEALVKAEVDRCITQEVGGDVVVNYDFKVGGLTQKKTRIFEMVQRCVRNNLRDYVRLCVFCQQPYLVPRQAPAMANPYEARPTDERCCERCRTTRTLKRKTTASRRATTTKTKEAR